MFIFFLLHFVWKIEKRESFPGVRLNPDSFACIRVWKTVCKKMVTGGVIQTNKQTNKPKTKKKLFRETEFYIKNQPIF